MRLAVWTTASVYVIVRDTAPLAFSAAAAWLLGFLVAVLTGNTHVGFSAAVLALPPLWRATDTHLARSWRIRRLDRWATSIRRPSTLRAATEGESGGD